MSLSIECPECASRYKVGDHLAGKRVKCKKCGTGIHVPDPQDLSQAKELPVKLDPDEIPVPIHPMVPHVKVKPKPKVVKAAPVARAEAFVAAEAFTPAPSFSAPSFSAPAFSGPPVSRPGQTIARQQNFDSDYSSGSRPIRATTAAPEGVSPMLLLIFVGLMLCMGGYLATRPNAVASTVWTGTISLIVCFFAIVSPMTWLGAWGASKAMRFELPSPAYIKAGAVVVTPVLLLLLATRLPSNPVLVAMFVLAIPPLTFLIAKLLFATTFVETLVTFILGGIGCGIGIGISLVIIGLIGYGESLSSQQQKTPMIVGNDPGNSITNNYSPQPVSPQPTPSYVPTPAVDSVLFQLTNIEQQARAQLRGNWLADTSKERATDQFAAIQNQLETLRPQATTPDRQSKLNDVTNVLDELKTKIAQLPSESPDPVIFQPITASGTTWQPSPGETTVPVSFKRYHLDVPTDARVDLASSEDAVDGLSWTVLPRGKINVTAFDRKDPRQERPWVKTHTFQKTDSADLFTLDMVNIPIDITYGKIGNLPATRIASKSSDNGNRFQPERFVKYVLADGQSWVVITCTAEYNDARTLTTLENSAWSVRQARGDEKRIDPFTADALVPRLREERAEVLVRRMGTAAEPALLAHINDSDGLLKQKVLELLADCGTKKSVPALLELSNDQNSQYAELARAAVKKISPADMDAATEALLDLQSGNFQVRGRGVEKLAAATPKADDPRRAKVCTALVALVRDGNSGFGIKPETIGDAIAIWQTPGTVTSLLPLLDNDPKYAWHRKEAMIVLAHTKDKRAAWPIARWLVKETKTAEDALISMGPVAEDDVIKVLDKASGKDQETTDARQAACRILGEIGTQKSLKPLGWVVSDNKAPGDADAANAAIAEIRDRIGAKGPAAPTGKTPAAPAAPERPQVNDPGLNGNIWIPPTTSPPRNAPKQ